MSGQLTATTEPPPLGVLKAGQCPSSCRQAEGTRCGCKKCGGVHHGLLLRGLVSQAGSVNDDTGKTREETKRPARTHGVAQREPTHRYVTGGEH